MRPNRRKFLKSLGAGATALALAPRSFGRANPNAIAIDFWDMRWGPVSTYGKAAKKILDAYNAANPKVSVSYEVQEWSDWPQVFSLALGTGTGPDISTGGSYQAVQYFDEGTVLPLDDVVADLKRSGDDKDFLPGALDQMVYNGHTVGLPYAMDLRVIFYRKDLLEKAGLKPPSTWDEIRATAKAVTTGGNCGLVIAATAQVGGHCLMLLLMNNDGGLFSKDGKLDVMNSRNLEAAQFLAALAKDGSLHADSLKLGGDGARTEFLAGRAAMIVDAPGLQGSFQEQRDRIGVLAPPTGPHGDVGTIAWIPNIMIYKDSKNPDAAKQFVKWWLANDKPLWTEGRCNRLPVRTSILSDPYFQNDPILSQIAKQWIPVGKGLASHRAGVFPFLNTLDGYGPVQTLTRDLISGKDVTASLQLAETRIKALMQNSKS